MKNIIKFITFIICTILIFLIKDFKIIGLLFVATLILAIILKLELKNICNNLKILLPFILFTCIINIIFSGIYEGFLIGTRMIICYNITYIYSKTSTVIQISETIQKLCYPLKFFKVDINNIGIMISISICMIPVLKNEIYTAISAMKVKGKKIGIKSMMIIMKPILISIFNKTREMETTLIAKAYRQL